MRAAEAIIQPDPTTASPQARFTNTLNEQEQSLLACQKVCKRLQEEVIEKEREEEGLRKRTSRLESELETIKNHLRLREEEVGVPSEQNEAATGNIKAEGDEGKELAGKEAGYEIEAGMGLGEMAHEDVPESGLLSRPCS
ncbi:UNVERIFIED_CONTAM: hypothetical protein K2H54_057910 [Gekko kuhli]